ncbi:MAG: aspartate carbamoyltransferase, partial [Nitrospiraceae bacterium]|nr:aspartate carbamoyltransferase [Nitrospiraceae bacterium]
MSLKRKDLLSLAPLSVDEINRILDTADSFKEVTGREIK